MSDYNEIGFYELIPGSIGTIYYEFDLSNGMSEAQKQEFVSSASNARMRAYLYNFTYNMLGNNPVSPEQAYINARKDSWWDLEDNKIFRQQKSIIVQIGQKESLDNILKIEKIDGFISWSNPHFISLLKTVETSI